MDINEDVYRAGELSAKLYGYFKIPHERKFLQRVKSGSSSDEQYLHEAIAEDVIEKMEDSCYYIVGPGTTTRAIMAKLGLKNTLLGVDLMYQKKLVGCDLNEKQLLSHLKGNENRAKVIITPIGGQGYILGRGNLQISPEVLRIVGRDNIILIATQQKINALSGRPLLVDTGSREVDEKLCDYYKITTGYHQSIVYKVTN
jgi:predicted polyphosphate/ATP-dependent NAD kinase